MNNTIWIVLSYSSLESQKKFEDYVFKKTGQAIDLGPISYGGKLTILFMKDDLSSIHHSNITCAINGGNFHFKNVDKFIEWYDTYSINKELLDKR